MKIAILHSGDLEEVSLGGVDRYIKSLILFSDDNEITVFGTTVAGKLELGKEVQRNYCGKQYKFIAISDDKRRPLSFYYMLKEFLWLKQLGSFDCIYAQRTEYSIPFLFSKNKLKLIEMIHGSSKYSEIGFGKKMARVHLLLEKLAIKTAKHTFVILNREEFGVPYYKKKYSKYKERIHYGRNPIDPHIYFKQDKDAIRNKFNIGINDNIILFSGRIEENPKRVLLLPHICKKVLENRNDVKFLILGDGKDKKKLENEVERLQLKDKFIMTGYVDDPHVIAEYNNAADIAINISMFEGTCTSVLESLACGIPVVSTDVGDIHECLRNGHNGFIIRNDEKCIVNDSADAIVNILNNGVIMDDVYLNYAGEYVIQELKQYIREL